jgi:uncharacterized protein (TIRG00374 family)
MLIQAFQILDDFMQKYLKYSLIALFLVFAGLGVLATLTDATDVINQTNPYFFTVSALFFIFSIVFWLISWAILIKKEGEFPYWKVIVIGFSCVYGALTPMQVGSEALRSIKLKEIFGINYSKSVSASMFVKGLKFFLIFLFASVIILIILLTVELLPIMFIGLISGFLVVGLATAIFLLPLSRRLGKIISRIFHHIGKKFTNAKKLEEFFVDYSNYLKKISFKTFVIVFILIILSFLFELLALQFAFNALSVNIELIPLLVLFIIISILERTPFLPRGIGLVEAAGFVFLSIPAFANVSLDIPQVGAILIIFAVVRLVIPTIISFIALIPKIKK